MNKIQGMFEILLREKGIFRMMCITFLSLLLRQSYSTTTQDDSILEGTWEYHDEIFEKPGLWACPHVGEVYDTPPHWKHNVLSADYIPPIGKRLLPIEESIATLTRVLTNESYPLTIIFIGDSLSKQKLLGSLCYSEVAHLKIRADQIRSRFLSDNPCGCFPVDDHDTRFETRQEERCDKWDPPSSWDLSVYGDVHMVVYTGGAWFSLNWLVCLDPERLEKAYENMLIGLIPTIREQRSAGRIVIWFALPYSLSKNPAYAHDKFKGRNEAAKRILSPEGVIVIDPYELVKTRIMNQRSVKCDELHFCGFGPRSIPVFEAQLILHYAAHSVL